MKSRDLKSLCETIASTVDETQPKQLAEGYINSLTQKARQVYLPSINEEKEEDEGEKEESPTHEKAEDKAEMLMKKLAAKALKRAKKKAATNEEVELAEKAAPGYEDWASDPKVKRSFKKQYGKDWKQVMYGRSWNMKKMDEEWGGGFQSYQDAHREVQAGLRREASIQRRKLVADIKAVHSGKMTKNAFTRKHKMRIDELPLAKKMAASRAKAKAKYLAKKAAKASAPKANSTPSIMESVQLDEISDTLLFRARAKAKGVGKFKVRKNPSFAGSSKDVPLHKKITQELQRRGSVPVSESEQLDEAGYKRLGRIKGAAYKAELASRGADPNTSMNALMKTAKLKRAAAEREAQVSAGMARRGGASPEAVKGGGSRIGKSGKYTQKAGKLANQRDKALASFRMKARTAQLFDKGEDQSRKRERQQAQAKFNMDARHGDFGHEIAPEIAKAVMRARYNYEKKYGRLKGK